MKAARIRLIICAILSVVLLSSLLVIGADAADLDRIQKYGITVNVNQDGTLDMVYEIDWKVLDSTSDGPLSWVTIGRPNKHYVSFEKISSMISKIKYTSSGGPSLRIDLDREYYQDEVVHFSFRLVQDYMYEMNMLTDGETVYEFTPGWFNDIKVDELIIRWNAENVESQSPSCTQEGGYYVWKKSLAKGEQFNVKVTYQNETYGFDASKTIEKGDYDYYDGGSDIGDTVASVIGGLFVIGFIILPIIGVVLSAARYKNSAGFSSGTEKKITRTRIEYYPECQGCGAPRQEGKDNCEYCGRSFIKSEEKIEEKDIPKEETEIRDKQTSGTYRYSSSPNTYLRVNVVNIPVRRSSSFWSSSSSSSSSRSSYHSSCAHSSCACACACACAGGGRAGCTVKDFYNTDLKPEYFKPKK